MPGWLRPLANALSQKRTTAERQRPLLSTPAEMLTRAGRTVSETGRQGLSAPRDRTMSCANPVLAGSPQCPLHVSLCSATRLPPAG